jgi:uncharacterized Ntn-hydrolase superfamily protein
MTFSLIGRCARTGQFGAAATTSSLAVGARVQAVAPRIGAVLTQHRTDPRLGPRGIALLRSGCTAGETIAALLASTPDHTWRQLAAIDAAGRTAHFHGARVKPEIGAAHGRDVVAIGNILASDRVPQAMAEAFAADPALPLAERLVRGLEAGEARAASMARCAPPARSSSAITTSRWSTSASMATPRPCPACAPCGRNTRPWWTPMSSAS